jgi:TRAP-type C4-dicarboxylate transport system permease small subunit
MGENSKPARFQVEGYIAAVLLFLLTILLAIQVVVRFVFGGGLGWTEEFSRYMFVWSIYFGCILAAKEDKHIRVTAQFLALPKRVEAIIITIGDVVWVAFNGLVAFFSFNYVISMFKYPYTSPTMGFNLSWIYTIVPLAYGLMMIYVILLIYKRIQKLLRKEEIIITDSRLGQ